MRREIQGLTLELSSNGYGVYAQQIKLVTVIQKSKERRTYKVGQSDEFAVSEK